ncbi:Dual specificity phosphatase, subgroup, catalytic domain protein [Metarhizium rileyi]|uniref:Dual specificity phosphatase, subgroup, catalytic domain protein n=1 Tax=Metarhizium rileyi (strain RCEF 4871) TaxID=1649241 RepID=A0A167ET54_METRR|nr:Dual specificity phosphatase, subgroup, catalytic domain protein [Metarhizium rileyi RCEF 4871]
MATIALPRPIPPHSASSDLDTPITPPHSLEEVNRQVQSQHCPVSLSNRHIPICHPGPSKTDDADTPPASPKGVAVTLSQQSLLFPPSKYVKLNVDNLCVFELDASQVIQAVDFTSRQPLPTPEVMFPWLHGLHPKNHLQQAFFMGRKRTPRRTPTCNRGILLVKANGDLSTARLKGAVAPDEFMQPGSYPKFIEADPREGFSVRNFQIQTAKAAIVSDVIVYGENPVENRKVAREVAAAQLLQRQSQLAQVEHITEYNTFICTSPFSGFENSNSDIVAIGSDGCATGKVLDFVQQERTEMWDMTQASEISHNVFMGPTPESGSQEDQAFDVLIECSDLGRLNPGALKDLVESIDGPPGRSQVDFPSSGSILPPTWSHDEVDGIIETCKWIFKLSHGIGPNADHYEGAVPSINGFVPKTFEPRKVLIHCADGYTESTMLGIAYLSYSTGQPVPDAWLQLHTCKGRNFFAYPTDVALLTAIAPQLLKESPACVGYSLEQITSLLRNEPKWLHGLDGSFPSRILNYLYLGNLGHANNPDLLTKLGIGQILSVGETASWPDGDLEKWGSDNVYIVQGVQDNGIDPLTDEFPGCLEFIERGRQRGTATLVHCRVGVSRSATICIAEVMRAMALSFPRAYCFVRARRLNVIIQPHLRFAYELLRWEEWLQQRGDASAPIKRELEWQDIAREISLMNRPYSR